MTDPDPVLRGIVTARAEAQRLIRSFSRPISGLTGSKAQQRPGGAARRRADVGGDAAGRAARQPAMRFGGGKA